VRLHQSRWILIMLLLAAGIVCGMTAGLIANIPLLEEIVETAKNVNAETSTAPPSSAAPNAAMEANSPAAVPSGSVAVSSAGIVLEPDEYAEILVVLERVGASISDVTYADGTVNPAAWEEKLTEAKRLRAQEIYQNDYQ
jgi:hypothetical protein